MSKGRFGVHGGQYMPETLMNAVIELEEAYNHYKNDPAFNAELTELLNNYAGRPSRLYFAEHMTNDLGGAKIYLKREDFMVRQIQEKAWQMRTLTVASYIFNLRKDLVSRLSVLFPERNIISEQLSSEQLPLGLLQGRFDYIITEYEIDEPNVCCVPYVTDKLWICLNKNDPLAHKRSIDINDLKNEKILLWAQSGFWASYIRKQYGQIVQLITVSGEQEYYDLIDAFDIRAFILDTTLSSAPNRQNRHIYVPLSDPAAQKTFYLCCQTKNERYIPQLVKK